MEQLVLEEMTDEGVSGDIASDVIASWCARICLIGVSKQVSYET